MNISSLLRCYTNRRDKFRKINVRKGIVGMARRRESKAGVIAISDSDIVVFGDDCQTALKKLNLFNSGELGLYEEDEVE